MKKYKIKFTLEANLDINHIYQYALMNVSKTFANELISGIKKICLDLVTMPERGNYPPEFTSAGINTLREVHYKVYRIIFHVSDPDVYIFGILDGRRNVAHLLHQRIMSGYEEKLSLQEI